MGKQRKKGEKSRKSTPLVQSVLVHVTLERLVLLLEPQSRSGDNPVKFQVVLSPNGTAVLKVLTISTRTPRGVSFHFV